MRAIKVTGVAVAMFFTILGIFKTAEAQSVPTISPFMYFGGGTTNIRAVSSTTKMLLGSTSTTTGSSIEAPSLTLTGILGASCVGTSAAGVVQVGICGSSGVGTSTEPFMANRYVATSTLLASEFLYASSTAITVSGTGYFANTTNSGTLGVTGLSSLGNLTFSSATGTTLTTTGAGIFGDLGGVYNYAMGSGAGTIGFNSYGYTAGVSGYGALMQLAPSTGQFTMFLESNVSAGAAHSHTTTLSWDNTGVITIPQGFLSQASSTVVGTIYATYASSTAISASGTIYAANFVDTALTGTGCVGESSGLLDNTNCVSSIASSGGSLTISSPTGNVDASLNLAHSNIWSALQLSSNTGTSTWSGGGEFGTKLAAPYLNATSTTATSTFLGGISTPSFSLGGTILSALSTLGFSTTNGTLKQIEHPSFTYSTTTTWTGTTTRQLAIGYGQVWNSIQCETSGGYINMDFYHGSSHLNYFTASTTKNTFTFTTNNTITASDSLRVDMGTTSASTIWVNCTVNDTV